MNGVGVIHTCKYNQMKKYLLLLFIVGAASRSHAQLQGQPLIDSLITRLATAKEDTNKVMLLDDLSLTYYSINPDEGLKYGQQGLALAEQLDWKLGKAYAYKVIAGNYGYGKSDFPNALKYYFDALKIHEEGGVKNEVAATLMNIGIVYNSLEDYPKALDYMLRANKIDEELGNKSGVAANLGNIGQLYISLGDTAKALESNIKSLDFYEAVGDKNGIARNLGLFEQLGDKNGAAKNFG